MADDRWIQVRYAVAGIADVYHEALKGDYSEARAKAIEVIVNRLKSGQVKSQSSHFFIDFRGEEGLYSGARSVRGKLAEIPTEFWEILSEATPFDIEVCDWVTGDFDFYRRRRSLYLVDEEEVDYVFYPPARGYAKDVRISTGGLPFLGETSLGAVERTTSIAKKRQRGRPKGSGGWAALDAPIVEKMHQLISENPGMTPHGAAGHFMDEAAGNASFERKQRRLAENYRKAHPGG